MARDGGWALAVPIQDASPLGPATTPLGGHLRLKFKRFNRSTNVHERITRVGLVPIYRQWWMALVSMEIGGLGNFAAGHYLDILEVWFKIVSGVVHRTYQPRCTIIIIRSRDPTADERPYIFVRNVTIYFTIRLLWK